MRNQKGFNDSSFSGASANNRRFSIAPAAFQEAKIKEDLKSTTVKKNQLQQENDGLRYALSSTAFQRHPAHITPPHKER